jgi:hypothetical protein
MKKIILIILLCPLLFISCEEDASTPNNLSSLTPCNLVQENIQFSQIQQGMNHAQIASILGSNGDHFRTDGGGSGVEIKYYRWSYCGNTSALECWLRNDTLALKIKNFSDNSCSNNVNSTSFSNISIGDPYSSVTALLGGAGDNFRIDYYPTYRIFYYLWYDCADSLRNIQVWFQNDSTQLILKSF